MVRIVSIIYRRERGAAVLGILSARKIDPHGVEGVFPSEQVDELIGVLDSVRKWRWRRIPRQAEFRRESPEVTPKHA